ncbi:tyrosine-type recombinase/integrase [Planococcus sp. CPCC 101016]|uniref:tyrosine-type recombinase/integrase n=1 Tax=Planococcus sp. CPCC 101016 TaxID=2599617 RepID=UPI0011B74750|nr:tyrosine-type recombinase/integrase [Planococcus sp. CPCC 101016]TWT07331.1 tyrosine-type recombinase/integrase [Planococcus sp. CPCC 101016]
MSQRVGKRVKNVRTAVQNVQSLSSLFMKFYEAKTAEGRTLRTLESYKVNFNFFLEFLEARGIESSIDNVTVEILRQYINYMLNEKVRFEGHKFKNDSEKTLGLSPITVNTRLKTLRTMFSFLLNEKFIQTDPMVLIKKVVENDEAVNILTIDELKRLLNVPNQRRYSDFRDYVLMNLLTDAFLRINEALSLTRNDIDFQSEIITIRSETSKSRRTRIIPVQKNTLDLLRDLIKETEEFNNEHVFLANYGARLDANHFRKRLKEFAKQAAINKRVHPHLFRHTGATIFLEAGGDIRHLQMILGHKDLRMVLRYTHLSNTALKNQHNQFSPINLLKGKLEEKRKILR